MDRIAEIEQKAANGYWETDGDESVFSNTPMLEDIRYLLARVKAAEEAARNAQVVSKQVFQSNHELGNIFESIALELGMPHVELQPANKIGRRLLRNLKAAKHLVSWLESQPTLLDEWGGAAQAYATYRVMAVQDGE